MYNCICNDNILSSYCKGFENALFAQADSELLVAELWVSSVCMCFHNEMQKGLCR